MPGGDATAQVDRSGKTACFHASPECAFVHKNKTEDLLDAEIAGVGGDCFLLPYAAFQKDGLTGCRV